MPVDFVSYSTTAVRIYCMPLPPLRSLHLPVHPLSLKNIPFVVVFAARCFFSCVIYRAVLPVKIRQKGHQSAYTMTGGHTFNRWMHM